jgi:hypothetical protein
MKKTFLLLFLLVSLVVVFASCGETLPLDTDTGSDTAGAAELDLPPQDFGGEEFTILSAGLYNFNDFGPQTNTGYAVVDSAIALRNAKLEQDYNITISTVEDYSAAFGDGTGFNRLNNAHFAGISDYDIAMVGTYDAAQLSLIGAIADLNALEYIDLTKPWWDQKANQDLSIAGTMFYTTGDISFIDNAATHMIMFNKTMAESYKTGDLYQSVRDGDWTFDKLIDITGTVTADTDGNNTFDKNDTYGLLVWNDTAFSSTAASLIHIAEIDDEGLIKLSFMSDKTVALVEKWGNFVNDRTLVYNYQVRDNTDGILTSNTAFTSGKDLFYMNLFMTIPLYRDTDIDFGILPFPKYDITQETYGHYISATHSRMFCIPIFAHDLDRSAYISEAAAYYGKQNVTPAYYDQTLKYRDFRDDESAEMLDIIFATRVFDVGIYYKVGGAIGSTHITMIRMFNDIVMGSSQPNNIVSRYESIEGAALSMIDVINASLTDVRNK